MPNEKLFTPKQAAVAVLDKVGEVLQKSELIRTQKAPENNTKEQAEGNNKPDGMEPKYEFKDKVKKELAKESAVKKAEEKASHNKNGAPFEKAQDASKPGAMKHVADKIIKPGDVEDVGHSDFAVPKDKMYGEGHEKGHFKLAKFIGRMDHKRSLKKGETGHEKGVHRQAWQGSDVLGTSKGNPNIGSGGPSDKGKERAVKEHKKVLDEMKSIKPKLGKAEHQPHPGPSASEHQKAYDAKKQAESEAHLKSPEGDAQRMAGNKERLGKK